MRFVSDQQTKRPGIGQKAGKGCQHALWAYPIFSFCSSAHRRELLAPKFPVSVSTFAEYVPHRPPMVWIDEVLSATKTEGVSRIYLDHKALYWKNGDYLSTACIEWVAQSFAYVRSAYAVTIGCEQEWKATNAFLVGIRNAKFFFESHDEELNQAKHLDVFVEKFRQMGPIIKFDGGVRLPSSRVLMKGSLSIYQS
jgi:predicted hotdog family 3-hydroxylacyl-ACP dehydratase